MGFIALILALLIEQLRPLSRDNVVHRASVAYADRIAAATNAGQRHHGIVGWSVAVATAVVGVIVAQWLLGMIGVLPVLALHVLVLYHTVGFRQFSHAFTEIQLALAANDPEGARQALQRWVRQHDPDFTVGDLPVNEVCRQAIAHALVAAHRHVFGPLFWYMLLPGAIGPVLYRAAQFLAERWQAQPPASAPVLSTGTSLSVDRLSDPAVIHGEPYGEFAQRVYRWLDWLPVRLAAAGFAIVGNFEDAVYCWRGAAAVRVGRGGRGGRGDDSQRKLLLMTGGGALGLRIADPRIEADIRGAEMTAETPDVSGADASRASGAAPSGFDWNGAEPDSAGLRSAVGLVWRSVVLWVLIFAMVTIANWLGR